jgi:F0F1-type ATP synthase gamma subunit
MQYQKVIKAPEKSVNQNSFDQMPIIINNFYNCMTIVQVIHTIFAQ